MLIASARIELQMVGYHVEVDNSFLYAREEPNSMPDRLVIKPDGTRDGLVRRTVSDQEVKRLLNRKQK